MSETGKHRLEDGTGADPHVLTHVPRYFFHLRNDLSVDDAEGEVWPTIEAALERARLYALDMTAASVTEHQKINLHHRIELADESGIILAKVEFGDVIVIEGRSG